MYSRSHLFSLSLPFIQTIQAQSHADAQVILSQGLATIQTWQTLYKEHFGKSLGEVVEEYSKESQLQANPSLLESFNIVRDALYTEVNCLHSLETYIHLLMPQMEDGASYRIVE